MAVKKIIRPQLKSAVKLSPREMNNIRFSSKHTVLSPKQLGKLSRQREP
ncbi:MAG: hypothetical protein NC212_05795 [Staphylococcus sp.]|nr:hypothetical protein [Staphylococcus sp.]